MSNENKQQLLSEVAELRQRVAELEKALQEQETETAVLLRTVPLGIHECDTEGRITFVNYSQETITGYTAEELLGTHIWDRQKPGPERDAMPAYLRRLVLEQPPPIPYISKNLRKNGESFDIRVDWNYKRDPQGKVTGFVSIIWDITEQKQAEDKLATSRAILEATIESLPFDFWAIGLDGRYLMQNSASRTHWGDFLGKHPEDIAETDENLSLWLNNNRRAFAGERITEEAELQVKGEKRFFHNVIAPIITDGRIQGILGVNIDITERKRAEVSVETERAMLEGIVESTNSPISAVDANCCYTGFNSSHAAAIKAIYGTDVELGKSMFACLTVEEDRIKAKSNMDRAMQGERFAVEERYGEGARSQRYFHIAHNPIKTADGKVTGVAVFIHDITERKRTEEALRKAHDGLEQRVKERTAELTEANKQLRQEVVERRRAEHELSLFKRLIDAAFQGFCMASVDSRAIYINPFMCRLLGCSSADVIGKSLLEFVPPAGRDKLEHELLPVVLAGGQWTGENVVQDIRGDGRPVLQSIFAIPDDEGKPARIATVLTDLTEVKLAQEALRESETKYRRLVETTDTGYVIVDPNGCVVDANAEYVRMTGHHVLSQIAGRNVVEWTAPYDAERNAQELSRCLLAGSTRQLEIDYLGPDGKLIPIEINASCVDTADGRRIITLCRDITDRKRAEEALRQSYEELRAIYDGMVDGLLIVDPGTKRFVRANSSMCRMLGYSEDELLSMSVMDIHPKEHLPAVLEVFQALVEGRLRVSENTPVLCKDGSVFYADIGCQSIVYSGCPGVIGFFRDITERKRAEEALRKEHRTLRHLLQSSDHERQLIAYEIHDGLAQYLAGALMQFEVYSHLKQARPKDAAKAYDAGTTMLRQGHFEARRLISGVRPPILDESGIVAAVAHLVNEERRQNGPKIEFHSEVAFDRLVPILENAVYRIIQEGLTNACKHSDSERVRVELVQHNGNLRIKIQDWGVGFNPNEVEEDCFGLAGIRERARLLAGNTTVESIREHGTCITVELPLVLRE